MLVALAARMLNRSACLQHPDVYVVAANTGPFSPYTHLVDFPLQHS
jgi:hypothetical protein